MKFIQRVITTSVVAIRLPEGSYEAIAVLGDMAPDAPAVEITMRPGQEIPIGPASSQRIQSFIASRESVGEAVRDLVTRVRDQRRANGYFPALALS